VNTRAHGGCRRSGFTLIEALIAMALVGIVVTKLTMVMEEARRVHQQESITMALDDQAMDLIDKIAYAVIGASAERVDPAPIAPFTSDKIHYQISMGVENGVPVWGDPEEIGMGDERDVYWGQNVGEVNERRVVWANTVSEMLQDELLNGVDDNQNDLADELGLAFVVDAKSVVIRLTLENVRDDGERLLVTRETTVTCRN